MKIGYARVSSKDQNLEIQIKQLEKLGCEKIFSEHESGKSADRTELKLLLDFARDGDVINVMKTDRLARSTVDAIQIADKLVEKGAGLILHDLGEIDINSNGGRVIYTVISAFAELERKKILQRCNEGRATARAKGLHLGRHKDEELHMQIIEHYRLGIIKTEIAKILNCSRSTVYRALNSLQKNVSHK